MSSGVQASHLELLNESRRKAELFPGGSVATNLSANAVRGTEV